ANYFEVRSCLERIITDTPSDASAWAILSSLYTYRSYFYEIGTYEEREELVWQAELAAQEAVAIAPEDYLTKVALMNLALRQGRVDEFDMLQESIQRDYPGDIYLQIRLATRLARL